MCVLPCRVSRRVLSWFFVVVNSMQSTAYNIKSVSCVLPELDYLKKVSSQLRDIVIHLAKELSCEEPGSGLNPVSLCKDLIFYYNLREYWIKLLQNRNPSKGLVQL